MVLKFRKVPWNRPDIGMDEEDFVARVMSRKWLTAGEEVAAFERELHLRLGGIPELESVVGVSSGTSAITVALKAHGVGAGDEVVVPSFTYVATVNAVQATGATAVLCDSDPETFNPTPETVREKITPKTKAIVILHAGGLPCDMDGFAKLAEETKLPIIEDAAAALGAEYSGKSIGSFGPPFTTCFSFSIGKQVTCGEGGAVVAREPKVFDRCRKLRHNADGLGFGYGCRMSELHAAIGRAQLTKLDRYIKIRQRAMRMYAALKDVGFQKVPEYYTVHPYQIAFVRAIPSDDSADPYGRERIGSMYIFMCANGIDARIGWCPVHRLTADWPDVVLPGAERAYADTLMLPIGNAITLDEIEYVIRVGNGEVAEE